MKLLTTPSAIKVGAVLCLLNLVFGLCLFALEYILGTEISGMGVLSTIMPAMITGVIFGQHNGELMAAKTRWLALLVWSAVSLAYLLVLAHSIDLSLTALVIEFGWFNLLWVLIMLVCFVMSYFILKQGEKMGIKSLQQKNNKRENNNSL